MAVLNIQRNPQDTSSFYLAQIYQQLSTQSNGSQPSIPSSLINPIEPFVPPTLAVWTCGLWFMSLVISLTCALVTISLQQWARRYLHFAYHSGRNPQGRARLRTFYRRGVAKLSVPLDYEWVPMLLHIAIFLFFAGISVYLFDIHRTIFKFVTTWIGVCIVLYAYLTVLPISQKNSPCSTPFSPSIFFCLAGIRSIFFHLLRQFPLICPRRCPETVRFDMVDAAEQCALELGSIIDIIPLFSTFSKLEEDSDIEQFFEGLSPLCESETGKKLEVKERFIDREPYKKWLSHALIGLIDRTVSSNLIKGIVKHRRMEIFTEVIKSTSLLDPSLVFDRVLFGHWHPFLEYIEFGLMIKNRHYKDRVTSFYAQCVASLTVSTVRNRDKRWMQVAAIDAQPFSRPLHYNEDRHNILLANAIHVVRSSVQTYSGSEESKWDQILYASRKTLRAVCELHIQSTSPELQHEFCDLWNKLVTMAQTDQLPHHRSVSLKMLRNIRKLYLALHDTLRTAFDTTDEWEQVMDNPGFYPKCTEDRHCSSSPFLDLQVNASQTRAVAHTPNDMRMPLESFVEPLTPSSLIPSTPVSSGPPMPSFPGPNPYLPAPN